MNMRINRLCSDISKGLIGFIDISILIPTAMIKT